MDLEDPAICDLTSEFVHGLLEFWFGDLHNLDEIPQEKYEMCVRAELGDQSAPFVSP